VRYPNGNRGGNSFHIKVEATKGTISLHQFWDGLILGSQGVQSAANEAVKLRNREDLKRSALAELRSAKFEQWAKDVGAHQN